MMFKKQNQPIQINYQEIKIQNNNFLTTKKKQIKNQSPKQLANKECPTTKESLRVKQEEKKILEYIKNTQSVRREQIREAFGLSERTANRRLQKLMEQSLIIKKRTGNTVVYRVN